MADDDENGADEPQQRRQELLAAAILVEGGLAGLALGLGALIAVPPGDVVEWRWSAVVWGLAGSLPMLAASIMALKLPWSWLGRLRDFLDQVVVPMFKACTLVDLAAISLLAGIGEEMLFRGVLQPAFAQWAEDPWIGILMAAVLFGVTHALSPAYVALATFAGIYLGALLHFADSLVAPVVAHAVYDFVLLWLLLRPERKPVAEELG